MAPAGSCRPRPSPVQRRPRSVVGKVLSAAVAIGAAAFAAARQVAVPELPAFALAGESLPTLVPPPRMAARARDGVVMRAEEGDEEEKRFAFKLRPWKGTSRYKTYDGYVFRKKKIPGVRLRLDRWGQSKFPYYRIKAAFQKRRPNRSGRFLESVGWWDPMRDFDDVRFFKLKADRCIFWLRNGAQPTDMVANLLDIAGIIRRTGPHSKYGEWGWRVPRDSGPEAPAGWSYDGPHEITWANKPQIHHRRGHPHSKNFNKIPLIERYGFKGYSKIPIDSETVSTPLVGDTLLESFSNTELPIY